MNDLKKKIENELKIKNEDFKEINEISNREKKQRHKNILFQNLSKYNKLFNELLAKGNFTVDIQPKIRELIELYDNIIKDNNSVVKDNKNINIDKISYTFVNNLNIVVRNIKENDIIYENEGCIGEFYISSVQLKNIVFENKNNNEIIKNVNKKITNISLYSLKFGEEKAQIDFDNNNDDNNDITLVFGNENTLNQFDEKFKNYQIKLKKLKEIFMLLLNKEDVISNCMLINKNNKKDINDFICLCCVKYSDDTKSENINECLIGLKGILEQISTDYNLISTSFLNEINKLEIKTIYKKRILKKDYELKEIPENIVVNDLVDFSDIIEKGSLSIPIINVDSETNEVSCCFNSIKCDIGSIYPSLFSEPYKINIITFSNNPLLLNLKKNQKILNVDGYNHESIEDIVKFDKKVSPNKPIEIEINIPKIEDYFNLNEIHYIHFNLEIQCQNVKNIPLDLPFTIKFELRPIIVKFSTNNKKIIMENSSFLISSNLYSGEEISFDLQQVEKIKEMQLQPFIQIEGLKDNDSKEPEILINEEKGDMEKDNDKCKINIIIPKNGEENKKMKIYLNIYYTDLFKISLLIDSIILPFNYKLLFYDFLSRQYKEENFVIKYNFTKKLEKNNIFNIYLKFEFPNDFNNKYVESEFSFENKYKQCINILNEDEIVKTNKIYNNFYFEIEIRIDEKYFPLDKIPIVLFRSKVNGVQKDTDITFINEDNENEYFKLDENIIDFEKEDKNSNILENIYFCIENRGILLNDDYLRLKNEKETHNNNKQINLRRNYIEIDFNNNNITLPNIKRKKGLMSIKDIEEFYNNCIKIIRALPSFIHSSILLKDNDKLREAEKIFCTIYEYYKIFQFNENDNSILNYKINEFRNNFISLVKRLNNSNFKLKKSNINYLFGIS